MKDFRQLKIRARVHPLALDVYKATSKVPKVELYGLTSKIRRARTSIPSNMAEG